MKLTKKLGLAGTSISLFGIAFGWGIFPWLLKLQIGKVKGLAPGSESRGFWERIPFDIDFKVYIFNVTNHLEVQRGEMPIVKEVGPYYYVEWKEKGDVIDYEEDDSVTFYMKNTWFFDKEKTAPLTGDETIIIPHPILVGLILATEREKSGALPLVKRAIPILFNKPDSIFLKTTVNEFLFRGIFLNCTTTDFAASAVCAVLKSERPDFEVYSTGVFRFSLFGPKNGTNDPNKMQISRGVKDFSKVGEMMRFNGKKRLNIWRGLPCNNLDGTDGTVFPPDIKKEEDIVSFNVELCKSIPAKYVRNSEYKGIPTLRYNVSLGDMSTEPSLKCLCPNETTCFKKGVMDLMKCAGAPVVGSLPHFHDCHDDYKNGVKGMNPNEEEHGIYLDIEPMTGTPLFAKKRIQFSFPIHRVNKIDLTQNLRQTLHPFIWVEESIEIPDRLIEKIDGELFRILRVVNVVKWLITILGAAVLSGGVGLYYKEQNSLPINPSASSSKKMGPTDFLADKIAQNNHEMGHTNLAFIQ